MKPVLTQGTLLRCSFGNLPMPMMAVDKKVRAMLPVAVKSDHVPLLNIPSFGMCSCPANPMVAAATAAALGVLTPAPCIPCTLEEWTSSCRKVKVKGEEALNLDSKLMCMYGGQIQAAVPVQPTVLL